ncbi:hypothetical protein [Prevotella disiens]|uniref:Uncharacterized protein n=1 Tax=Prevotella disiens DNF00882 TaxID=1401075 RepID=A0A096AUJ7_9BACT|nr:hypothetical protein [Prevotella disiens]KGF50445.1 hypothetical protein HMPREF0654_01045 [Prevotella disiens DNF00882]
MPTEFTIEQYLRGSVRNIDVPDNTLLAILAKVGVKPDTPFSELSEKESDLSLAGLYIWLASSPTSSKKVSDKDAHWEHSEGGETMSAHALNRYLRMANDIYAKYNMPTVGNNKWGMIGRGIHNIRHDSNYKERNL